MHPRSYVRRTPSVPVTVQLEKKLFSMQLPVSSTTKLATMHNDLMVKTDADNDK